MNNNTDDKLLYIEEHLTCPRYLHKIEEGFILKEIHTDDVYVKSTLASKNHIIALLSGSIELECDQHSSRTIKAGEMFLFSRSAVIHSRCIEDTRMVIFYFEIPRTNCDKINFQELREIAGGLDDEFKVLPIRSPLKMFFTLLSTYLKIGANCSHLHEIKQIELFLSLRYFYTKEELAAFFYPVLYKKHDFRCLVLENYEQIKSIKELVELSHMSKSVFFEKFKKEFGMSAKQWILAKMTQKMEYMALEPGMTVKELMAAFKFDSLSSFQRFCKQHTGRAPTELLNRNLKQCR